MVVTTLIQISSSSTLLDDIADIVKSVTALDIGDLAPDLLQTVISPSASLLQCASGVCGGGCCPVVTPGFRPPSTSASFYFSSTGSHAVAGSSALTLAPAGLALGLFKGLLIGNDYLISQMICDKYFQLNLLKP